MGAQFFDSSLDSYKERVGELYKTKGWNTDWRWLATGYLAESGELIQSIIKEKPEREVLEEFADVMHYLLELMNMKTGRKASLDAAFAAKIESNKINKKKTTDKKGRVIFR